MIYKLWYATNTENSNCYSKFFESEWQANQYKKYMSLEFGDDWDIDYVELKSDSPILFSDFGMINGKYKKIFNLLKGEQEEFRND